MNKEMTDEETEEYYNKLWLENKELIQKNIERLDRRRFELELELVEKDKKIERLNNIINKAIELIELNICGGSISNANELLNLLKKESE